MQEGEASASVGSEILSVRIPALHQRIIKFRRLPALRFAAVAQHRKTITEAECGLDGIVLSLNFRFGSLADMCSAQADVR